jgi:hypothetical protein
MRHLTDAMDVLRHHRRIRQVRVPQVDRGAWDRLLDGFRAEGLQWRREGISQPGTLMLRNRPGTLVLLEAAGELELESGRIRVHLSPDRLRVERDGREVEVVPLPHSREDRVLWLRGGEPVRVHCAGAGLDLPPDAGAEWRVHIQGGLRGLSIYAEP